MTPAASLLADGRLEQLDRDGWTLVPDVFTSDECARIVERIEAAAFKLDLGRPHDGQMAYRPMMRLADPELQDVCCDPRWRDVVAPAVALLVRLVGLVLRELVVDLAHHPPLAVLPLVVAVAVVELLLSRQSSSAAMARTTS